MSKSFAQEIGLINWINEGMKKTQSNVLNLNAYYDGWFKEINENIWQGETKTDDRKKKMKNVVLAFHKHRIEKMKVLYFLFPIIQRHIF